MKNNKHTMAKRKKNKQWTPLFPAHLNRWSKERKEQYAKTFIRETKEEAESCDAIFTEEAIIAEWEKTENLECWKNDLYTVLVDRDNEEYMGYIHISFRRNDRQPVTDWRHKQNIKNQLIGEECEAIELFPAESRLVDQANQYHMWGLPDPKNQFPVGFNRRFVHNDIEGIPSKQRDMV